MRDMSAQATNTQSNMVVGYRYLAFGM